MSASSPSVSRERRLMTGRLSTFLSSGRCADVLCVAQTPLRPEDGEERKRRRTG